MCVCLSLYNAGGLDVVGWGGVGGGMRWDASGSNDRPGVSSVAKSQDQLMMHNIEKK